MDVNKKWIEFKKVILNSAQEQIGHEMEKTIRKPWITQIVISKTDKRMKRKKQTQ